MPKSESIVATPDGFSIHRNARQIHSARWDDVVQVRAYKRDELTRDLLCLDVLLRNGQTWFLHEEAPGWTEFLAAAETALPGMHPFNSWFSIVAFPAFERNEIVI